MMFTLVRHLRFVAAISLGLVLLAGGCSFEDIFEGGFDQEDAAPDSTAPATQTPWKHSTPTATAPATHTAWVYVPATPTRMVTRTATPTPTRTPTPSPTPSPTATPVVNLLDLLPTADDVPDNMRLEREEATLTAEQVASEAGDSSEYLRLLETWGFRGGSLREYQLPSPGIGDFMTELLGLEARALEFDTRADALAAIEFQREFARQRPGWNLKDANVEPLGDASFALTGTADYDGTEVTVAAIFVQDGNRVFRFVGIGGVQKPFDETLRIAKRTLS